MSQMFVIAIDDNVKAQRFLTGVQENHVVAFLDGDGTFRRAPVSFIYRTDATGKCVNHEEEITAAYERGVDAVILSEPGPRLTDLPECDRL